MKTLVPDEEKLNDASPPEGNDDSVDTAIGTPEPIQKVPDLPENCDEELLNHPTEEKPSETLKGKRGRRKKKGAFTSKGTIGATEVPFLFTEAQDYSVMRMCERPLIPLSRSSIKRLTDEFEVAVLSRRKKKSNDPHWRVKGARLTSLQWLIHY